jgi:hypothetical protein
MSENKIVLTGTYEGSYSKFRGENKNKKNDLNIVRLFFKKLKKQVLFKM